MAAKKTLKITNMLLALAIIGEAIALLIGMLFFNTSGDQWLTISNIILLSIDILTGVLLIIFSFKLDRKLFYFLLSFNLATIVGSHIYRNIDFATNGSASFAFNIPLLIVNNLKLIAAFYALGLVIYSLMNWEREKLLVIEDLE